MNKAQEAFGVYKVCIMRGIHWVQFPAIVIMLGAAVQDKAMDWWGIGMPIKYTVPLMLLLTWLVGRIELALGLVQAETNRNFELNPGMKRVEEKLNRLLKEDDE